MPAQQPAGAPTRSRANELTLTAEPLAGGARYLRKASDHLSVGVALTTGPLHGVVLARGEAGRLREWATLAPVLAYRIPAGPQLLLSPIGAVLALGDDFGALYPGGMFAAEIGFDRLRVSSLVRGFRIAGGDGSGHYRVQWLPIQVGYAFRW